MRIFSVSEFKAKLSEQLKYVQSGEEVLVTDRGRPVARVVPVSARGGDAVLDALEVSGLLRRGEGRIDDDFFELERPFDPEGALGRAVATEREEGW